MSDARSASRELILVVDDSPSNLFLLTSILTEHGYQVRPVNDGEMVLEVTRMSLPDLILLDVYIPGKNGYQVCKELKADEELKDIPVIFVSALDDARDKVIAFEAGGVDYISKPYQAQEVIARIENHLELYRKKQEVDHLRRWERDYFKQVAEFKDELLQMASHDLKNPLNSIIGAVALIRESKQLDEANIKMLDIVERGAHNMLTLVTDLLDLAGLETAPQLKSIQRELNQFIEEQLDSFKLSQPRKHTPIRFVPSEEAILLTFDPGRMEQVLQNLLSNAVKYTAEEGTITVRVSKGLSKTALSKVAVPEAIIEIQDTGYGMPPGELTRIFDRFYRVNSPALRHIQGSGLGLTIVQSIVKLHNGHVEVKSTPGEGSTFRVHLPLK